MPADILYQMFVCRVDHERPEGGVHTTASVQACAGGVGLLESEGVVVAVCFPAEKREYILCVSGLGDGLQCGVLHMCVDPKLKLPVPAMLVDAGVGDACRAPSVAHKLIVAWATWCAVSSVVQGFAVVRVAYRASWALSACSRAVLRGGVLVLLSATSWHGSTLGSHNFRLHGE